MIFSRPLCITALLCAAGGAAAEPATPGAAVATDTPAPPAAIGAALPAGSIIAFVPQASGFTGTTGELRDWLGERGWALCDGTRGTPDLGERMLLGTTDPSAVGMRLGSHQHSHRVRGETGAAVLRNRHTPTGHGPLVHLADDQHRHPMDAETDAAPNLPPSVRVLFIMKVR